MIGRAGFGAMLVCAALILDGLAIAGLIYTVLQPIKIDAAVLGTIMGIVGLILGHINAMAMQPVSWAFGSSVGSQKKDETIQTMAGKG